MKAGRCKSPELKVRIGCSMKPKVCLCVVTATSFQKKASFSCLRVTYLLFVPGGLKSFELLVSEDRPRLYLLSKIELIARRLRRPIGECWRGQVFLVPAAHESCFVYDLYYKKGLVSHSGLVNSQIHTNIPEEGHIVDSLRVPVEARVAPRAKYILASNISCVTNELAVFSIDIAFVNRYITSQTCYSDGGVYISLLLSGC